MSPDKKPEILGKSYAEVVAIHGKFVEKFLTAPPTKENPMNGAGIGLTNYGRGRARFAIHVFTVTELTPEHFKSLKLPKKSFQSVPIKYECTGEFVAA